MRNTALLGIVSFILFGWVTTINAQIFEIHSATEEPYLPSKLIKNYFLGEGVEIQSIKYSGSEDATGFFQGAEALIGIDRGIVLSTGKVSAIKQAASKEASTVTSTDLIVDEELSEIVSNSIVRDISKYEISFIPTADLISFNYVFASEEYPDYVCSQFNDIFGFFLTGPNPNGAPFDNTNIAITPNSQNEPVSINTVNSGIIGQNGSSFICETNGGNLNNGQYYHSNDSDEIVFDGILSRFNASVEVIPCQIYTMKFAIADIRDELLDSAVFLEAKSFSSNDLSVQAITANSNGIMVEGCQDGVLKFEISSPATEDQLIDFKIIGNAQNEIDYIIEPTKLIIENGQTEGVLNFQALEDDLEEGIEEIGIVVSKNSCSKDTIWIAINDSQISNPDLPELIVQCSPEEVAIDASVEIPSFEPMVFSNNQVLEIFPEREAIYSEILVNGIYPSSLAASNFAKVCIDELAHPWIEDLDIFLVGPDGQFIELSTDNGEDGGNTVSLDYYRNTCFTINANQKIYGENPGGASYDMVPFEGDFLPEGSWKDFTGNASFKVNGIWKLLLIDDYATGVGTLKKWSIHFDTNYDLSYKWSPSDGLSCTDCPKPIANPLESTNYHVTISDSNGCEIVEEVEIQIGEELQRPVLECDESLPGQISFNWAIDPAVESYSINVNGIGWENIGLVSSYLVQSLSDEGIVAIELMGLGLCSESPIATLSCSNLPCQGFDILLLNEPKISCSESLDAVIKIAGQDNGSNYTYILGNEENNTGIFSNLGTGLYSIQVINEQNCTELIEVLIEDIEAIKIEADINHVSCNGLILGSIHPQISGGTGPYSLLWSTSSVSMNLTNVNEGVYTLTVTDQNNCIKKSEFIIESTDNFELNATVKHPSCDNIYNGSITFSQNILDLEFESVWSDGTIVLNRNDLSPGTYKLLVANSDGCEYSYEYELKSTYNLKSISQQKDLSCFGDSNGSAKLEIENGIAPYEVNWASGHSSFEITNLRAGIYTYVVTDANGCQTSDSIIINTPEKLGMTLEEIVEPVCAGFPSVSINLEAFGGVGSYKFRSNENEFSDVTLITNLGNGMYHFEVSDANDCSFEINKEIFNPRKEEIRIAVNNNVLLTLGETEEIEVNVLNYDSNLIYHWISEEEENALSCYGCPNPIFQGLKSQTILLQVIDDMGCEAEGKINFRLEKELAVYVPNVFSPNGDGINDKLTVFGKESSLQKINSFEIYDRWGNQVFNQKDFLLNDQSIGWNGAYRGQALNPGVFVWKMVVEFIDGSTTELRGDLSIHK